MKRQGIALVVTLMILVVVGVLIGRALAGL